MFLAFTVTNRPLTAKHILRSKNIPFSCAVQCYVMAQQIIPFSIHQNPAAAGHKWNKRNFGCCYWVLSMFCVYDLI